MGIYFKRKERIIEKITTILKAKDVDFIDDFIFEKLNNFLNITDVDSKISVGKELTAIVCDITNKNLHLRIDGDVSQLVNELIFIDEKILELKRKYNMSVLAYDIARKKSIGILFFRKHKESKDITNIEE